MNPVSQGQTGGTEGGVAGGDGADHHADHSQGDADAAHGLGAHVIDGGGLALSQHLGQSGVQAVGNSVDGAAGSGPHQGDDALTDHGAVEHHVALTLGLHAPGHQRRLGGVEAGDGAAGHGDEHEAPDGSSGGVHVVEVGPDLRNHKLGLGDDAEAHAHSHDDKADAEDGVNLTDDLIDGDKGCDEVVDQNDNEPEQRGGENAAVAAVLEQGDQQSGGAHGKHRAHHDQQHHGEHTHDVLHHGAQVLAGNLGNGGAVVALAHHAGEVVVDAAGKDGAEGNPQEHHRSPQSALHGAEDGAEAGDVQKLYQEQLPLGHHDVVNTVVDADSGSFAIIRTEGVVHYFAVGKVAAHQDDQTQEETDHKEPSLIICGACKPDCTPLTTGYYRIFF